jgi:hypothetical protein
MFLKTILLALIMGSSVPARAAVDVHVSIPLPPLIVFSAPPAVVVIPETYVYAVPDVDADIFFHGGWWWRPWEGRWYRSRRYDSGWGHYRSVPSFYRGIPQGWRNDYRERRWKGKEWEHERIPHEQVQRNWSSWEKNKHWEKEKSWGVKGLKPQTRSQKAPSRSVQTKSQPKQKVQKAAERQPSKPQGGKPGKGNDGKQGKK